MKVAQALGSVFVLLAAGFIAGRVGALRWPVAALLPYAAALMFLAGICCRVARWAKAPVPFRIPTTCGQQRSLTWIKPASLESPFTGLAAAGRMALEILLFRSLFRNSRAELRGQRAFFGEDKWLWLGALAFHWSLLMILLRHLRLFVEPVPAFVLALQNIDGFFQIGTPEIYLSDVVVLAALAYLLWRRLRRAELRFISLYTDYFALFLLLAIAVTGVLMRYVTRIDTAAVKQLLLGLVTFAPAVPGNVGSLFFAHLVLVSALAAYFPFSKLVHLGGVFLSPTRNLANNSRAVRHVNPWNYPVPTHTYAEWEQEFRDKLQQAEIPLEAQDVRSASAD